MKKIFTFCFALLAGFTAFAQSNSVEFVDAAGNIIPSGTTYVCDDAEVSSLTGKVVVNSGISVKNTTSGMQSCKVSCEITDMPSGQFQICGFGGCVPVPINDRTATYPFSSTVDCDAVTLQSGEVRDTRSEWLNVKNGEYGSFNVVYSIEGGSRITVNYVYADLTGISNVNAPAEKEVVGYYTIGGQRIDKPQKGLTIIKYSDGTTKKKILR